jgi:hypothetical protein
MQRWRKCVEKEGDFEEKLPFMFVLRPIPIPQKKTTVNGTVSPRFVLFIFVTNCAQNTPFNTKKERTKERKKVGKKERNTQPLPTLIFLTVTILQHIDLLK